MHTYNITAIGDDKNFLGVEPVFLQTSVNCVIKVVDSSKVVYLLLGALPNTVKIPAKGYVK